MNNVQALGRLLAAACALAAAFTSTDSHAANVGYFGVCYGEDPRPSITAAGHTPVAVGSLTAASLSGLSALYVNACNFTTTADLNTAVNAGLTLIVHDPFSGTATLPGSSATRASGSTNANIDFSAGAAVLNGPGGLLNNATLDNGSSSNHGHIARAQLPAGATVFATTADTSHVITYQYSYGAGRVLYSTIPLGCYLPGGNCANAGSLAVVTDGMQRYAANVIAWAAGPGFTTCAAEGFSGGKLTMCQKICEIDQTPSMLTSLIRLYRAAYREDPPCAN